MSSSSQWTKEVPTEPGWYFIFISSGEMRICNLFIHPNDNGRLYCDEYPIEEINGITYWGPRIEFPELPESEEE